MSVPVTSRTIRRIAQFAVPYAGLLACFVIVVLLTGGLEVAIPLVYRKLIDDGIVAHNLSTVIRLALLTGMLALVASILSIIEAYLTATISARVVFSLRTALFYHIQSMPLTFFTHVHTGALATRFDADLAGAQTAFTNILSVIFGNGVTIVLILGAMLTLSWQIGVATLLLVPAFVMSARFVTTRLQKLVRQQLTAVADMNTLLAERFNVPGARIAKLFNRLLDDSREFGRRAARLSTVTTTLALYIRVFFAVLILLAGMGTALAYGWGGVLVVHGVLRLGTLAALVEYLARLRGPCMTLSNAQVTLSTALVSFERVFEVLDITPLIADHPDCISLPRGPAEVVFDSVCFQYPPSSKLVPASLERIDAGKDRVASVISNVSFTAKPGQLTAIVGPSGSGKSTIASLLARLYDVRRGSIYINGIDIRRVRLSSLYDSIGMVAQDSHLFQSTIRDNLLYAKPNATDQELISVLRQVNLWDVIASLPESRLDVVVGDRGYCLSGGERQRFAIARILLRDPDIIVLDEATAHLDSESEAALQSAIEKALHTRTIIVIAHRLSTIVNAHQILVLNEGRIVQRGTHAELIRQHGLYRELYDHQFTSAGRSL